MTPNWSPAALADAAAAAHEAGARITMHATIPASIEEAIEAGFDAIEHGHGATTDHLRAMAAAGMALVPTLLIGDYIRQLDDRVATPSGGPRDVAARGRCAHGRCPRRARRGRRRLRRHRRRRGRSRAGRLGDRAVARRGAAGAAALAAGSWAARTWLGLPGLEEGAPADLVVFPDDPREDPEVLRHPSLIMLRGTMRGRP